MKYLKEFNTHASYEDKINIGGSDLEIPIVSYCDDVSDVHYNPYNTVEFYVGNITGTTPQIVKIYTDRTTFDEVQVSDGNKWYTYLLPKDNGLYKIEGDSVKKVVVKADINKNANTIIPHSTVEASFKGSNTSNVTNMSYMFNSCNGLISLDLSSFDTSNVTTMVGMFQGCYSLTSLTLSNFDTSNVTTMNGMFNNCDGLTSLDVSSFDTSNVTSMTSMFSTCNVTSLDLSNFDTSNVTTMDGMFQGCHSLTSLTLSNFDTSNVTTMNVMFKYCSGLTSLNLSGWVINNATNTTEMFKSCTSLSTITMVGCSPETVEKIQNQLTADGIKGVTISQ